ncbi:hypothetical protein Tco_1305238 [Tanacetum coccineum]
MDVAYRFPLHKYQNEIKNIDFRVEGYFRINIETNENVETKHFTISDDYGKSLNDFLTTIQGNNCRPYDGNKFFVRQNFTGYGVMYTDLLGQRGEDNLVGVQIGCEALKWNRAYAIDALGLLTKNRYTVEKIEALIL